MTGATLRSTIAIALSAALFSSVAHAQANPRDEDPAEKGEAAEAKVEGVQRFDGVLALDAKRTSRVAVTVTLWTLHKKKEKIQLLPESGLLLVELRAGRRCATIIDGKRVERKEGDFWVVPAGSSMGVEIERFAIVLQTTALHRLP